ncbi:MAG: hypothetical protein U1F67_13100 [Rubrivivax sp.]
MAAAPGGRYALPSVADCHACHDSAAVPVLGFSAVQLTAACVGRRRRTRVGCRRSRRAAAERAADAVIRTDLRRLVATRRLRGLPVRLLATPPRIAAANDTERAALGYCIANCGHRHNRSGNQAPLALTLAQRAADPEASRAEVLASTLNAASRWRMPGSAEPREPREPPDPLIAPGDAARSLLVQRMATREPRLQMPPIGTNVPDPDGLALLRRWITQEALPAVSPPPATHRPRRKDRP